MGLRGGTSTLNTVKANAIIIIVHATTRLSHMQLGCQHYLSIYLPREVLVLRNDFGAKHRLHRLN